MEHTYLENKSHGTSFYPLQVYSHADQNGFYFVSQHWHDEMEWIYVEEGLLNIIVSGQQLQISAGEFCFINSGELHEISSSKGNTLHHAIVFSPQLLNFAYYDVCQHHFLEPITGSQLLFPTIYQVSGDLHQKILQHFKKIISLYHELSELHFFEIKINLMQVIGLLLKESVFYKNMSTNKDTTSTKLLKKTVDYIQKNYMTPISLKDLSAKMYMSPNYFCSFFHKKTGKTPIAFINDYRIEKAANLLSNTELPITQIAPAVGFQNLSYFIRKFKEKKKVSPKRYRELAKSLQ